jgi:hypothetical protein
MRWTLVVACALAAVAPPVAQAKIDRVFGGKIACREDAESGVRHCVGSTSTRVTSFDGQPLDVSVAFPPGDGPHALLIVLHGYAGEKSGQQTMINYAKRGYAAMSVTARGFGGSCGIEHRTEQECADPKWHVRLADARYEVRDVQHLAGLLVDEGLVDPVRIGATGGSYGGGQAMILAALRSRVMLPDATLAPWLSPKGVPMELAVATPSSPWTDLAQALVPNGRGLDYVVDSPYGERIGVQKTSWVAGLYAGGQAFGFYAPPGTDPGADLISWFATTSAGEATDANPLARQMIDELTSHHSAYYIDDSIAPAPLYIQSGSTDDLFPADETLRFYNRTRARHPEAVIGLTILDAGHARAQSKSADTSRGGGRSFNALNHYLIDKGTRPRTGIDLITQTCGADTKGELISAPDWASVAPGEVRQAHAGGVITSTGGDPRTGVAYDGLVGSRNPIAPGNACTTVADGPAVPGTLEIALPAVSGNGYTLAGSPTVVADITAPSPTSQIAARLVDVAPDGSQTLVARSVDRPDASGRQVFQLHPNGWRFAAGHHAELQLLGHDAPYARPSNGAFAVVLENVEVRLPVADAPGSAPAVLAPAAKLVPAGQKRLRRPRRPARRSAPARPAPRRPAR